MDIKAEIINIKCRIRIDIVPTSGNFKAQSLRWSKLLNLRNMSGRPTTSVTKANIAAVKVILENDERLSDFLSRKGLREVDIPLLTKGSK
jgi:hypothetical protein